MSCQKSLDFDSASGAHLTYYWTMDEAGALNKIDSAQAHSWNTQVGSSSPAGLFVNGIQLDCNGGNITPNAHGLYFADDPGLAVDAVTSTGISFWFWVKLVATGAVSSIRFYFEFYTADFSSDYLLRLGLDLSPGVGTSGWNFEHLDENGPGGAASTGVFDNAIGQWHMVAGTLDKTNHQLKFYVDGVLKDTQVDTLGYNSTTLGWTYLQALFGGGGIGDTFNAIVDEFGLSLKGVLTQAQITSLFNAGIGNTWPAVAAIVPYP